MHRKAGPGDHDLHVQALQNWIQQNVCWAARMANFFQEQAQKQDAIFLSIAAGSSVLLLYLAAVRHLRYKNINEIRKKYPNSQDVLDNIEIAREVNAITIRKEFPFVGREGAELALFKTYTIPTISKLLAATGEFKNHCTRRAEDTELILLELTETFARIQRQLAKDPNTPEEHIKVQWQRPDIAATRLNELHGKYSTILNDDYIYTLSLLIYEPALWINRYEWRQLDERETNAMFRVWYEVGVAMKIKDIPDTPEKMLDFKNRYADEHIKYAPSNWKCGEPTFRHLLSNIPPILREPIYKFGLYVLPSVLDPADAKAFQLPQESKVITLIFKSIIRTPFYPNNKGKYVPEFFYYKPRIYEDGYSIPELGPEKFKNETTISKCPFMH
ncbi:hypothetical protein [Parasitella parasitica]|uniref:ER-bound oxygenase mpaB/mpaB'/Rubber oxygenase catalytic domain-containing protein n=1 Tax=Parasitella parasitica TaxID=35722 RepID=A0A0B7N3V9_9FUNG|nr:hypothetical protein [Parasitella parasitica]